VADPALAADINAIARLKGRFTLRSGQVSEEYFDKYRFESEPDLLRRVARAMVGLLPADTEMLAGLELGGVPIATALSLETGLPTLFVRKVAKDYGTCRAVEGGEAHHHRIVLVEDVITTGGAIVQAADLVRQAGGQVIGIVCAIWRGTGAPRVEGLANIPVRAVLTKDRLDEAAWLPAK
jgi:orotate phosphoribosyltransferase